MKRKISLKGCFPPIPTPFDDHGRVDHDRLSDNLEKWQRTSLAGFVVLGSNGEAVFLRETEKLDVWKTCRSVIRKERLFIAGTGCESTSNTIELTEKAARFGADAAMVVTPHYYKPRMDHRALVRHYEMIADHSPIPIILYNVPAFTGIDLAAETIIDLAQHPNVIGIKESMGNLVKIGHVTGALGDEFQVLAGSGGFFLSALVMGAVGGVMALANVAPEPLTELLVSFGQANLKRGREIQARLIPLNTAVTTQFGIAGLKAALDLTGMYGGPVRSPLVSLDSDQQGEIKKVLKGAGILEA
ncbi:MAG: dihydrodipicolinate synthase family protein [Proteobacteria bacterium]|nr:dihydrodipicolinate synthase family protein [Pseudomonadota bacterium]